LICAISGMACRVLILVENLPSPFERRVWQEATTLRAHGCEVTNICPTCKGYEQHCEAIDANFLMLARPYWMSVAARGTLPIVWLSRKAVPSSASSRIRAWPEIARCVCKQVYENNLDFDT